MKKVILLVILVFIISSCSTNEIGEITSESCADNGGHWNECGSPCAGTGSDFCIEICEPICECGGIAGFGCPKGYTCQLSGKIVDEMGKCIQD
jgi:hypothetical protein